MTDIFSNSGRWRLFFMLAICVWWSIHWTCANAEDGKPDKTVDVRACVAKFCTTVRESVEDADKLTQQKAISKDELKSLQTQFQKVNAIESIVEKATPTYSDGESAISLIPIDFTDGTVKVVCLELEKRREKWLVSKANTLTVQESIGHLIRFRREHADATQKPYVQTKESAAPLLELNVNVEKWNKATEIAIEFARNHPPQRTHRPEALRSMDLGDKEIAELLADGWNFSVLRFLGSYSIDRIYDGLKSADEQRRLYSLFLLEDRPVAEWNTRLMVRLQEMLVRDPSVRIRYHVALLTERLDNETAIDILVSALSVEGLVFFYIVRQLGERCDERAFEPLLEQLSLESDWDRQSEVAVALLNSAPEKAWFPIMVLATEQADDSRAFELIGRASRKPSVQRRRSDWPVERRDLEQIVCDVDTIHGERFGEIEINKLIDYIADEEADSSLQTQCRRALIDLQPFDTTRLLDLARKDDAKLSVFHETLMSIPNEDSVKFLIEESKHVDVRNELLFKRGAYRLPDFHGRWKIPLLMVYLDEPNRTEISDQINLGRKRAHASIAEILRYDGMEIPAHDLDRGPIDLSSEIEVLKEWWKQYGDDFMADKHVPTPKITNPYMFVTKEINLYDSE